MTSQTDIFAIRTSSAIFAEVCTALYERELHDLAGSAITDAQLLKRKLDSLPILVKRAAEYLTLPDLPINLDVHNASWQYKQSRRPPSSKSTPAWLDHKARLGLVVPVGIELFGDTHFELDSLDQIDHENQRVHLNKNGWFDFSGDKVNSSNPNKHERYFLLKPTKSILCAACCGHVWSYNGRRQPRVLSLREILLSGSLNWKAPTQLRR